MSGDAPLAVFSSSLVKTVCDRSLSPRDELGQNFLIDWEVPRREVECAGVDGSDTVLEVGPGLGSLTVFLAERAGATIAVEKDERMEPMLAHVEDAYGNLDVVYGDVLDEDLGAFDFDKVVANLPYGVALPIIFELLDEEFDVAVLLVQKELADRITRSPGESGYNRLSVQFARKADVESVFDVAADAFYPPPDVDSAVVKLDRREEGFEVPSEEFFKTALMFFFSQREKTIHQALFGLVEVDDAMSTTDLTRVQQDLGDVADTEVGDVTPREFGEVANCLWDVYGDGLLETFEAYFEKHGLYKRARGENDE